jgi:hypothetical protein
VPVEPVAEGAGDLAVGLLGHALVARAVGIGEHAQLQRSAGDLGGVAGALRALAQAWRVVDLTPVDPAVRQLGATELVGEVSLAPRVGGHRGAGHGVESVGVGGRDAVGGSRRGRAGREHELGATVGVLLDRVDGLPSRAAVLLEDGAAAFLRGRERRRHGSERLVGGDQVLAVLDDARQHRECDGLIGRAEELHVGERRPCDQDEHDQRDDELGSGQRGVPLRWPPSWSGPTGRPCPDRPSKRRRRDFLAARAPRRTGRGRSPGSPPSVAQGPRGLETRRGPCVVLGRVSRRAPAPRVRRWPAPRA